jgi:hypothetical protein
MFKTRTWIVISVALVLVVVVCLCEKYVLATAWGNVVINLVSDFAFVVILPVVFGLFYRGMITDVRNFFGVERQTPIQIYISAHKDPTTITGGVLTAAEREIADELASHLKKQFPAAILDSWARLSGIDLDVPEVVIKGSPLEEVKEWPYAGGLILIGGPTRNTLSEFYLGTGDPWVTFDDEKKFLVRRDGQAQMEEMADSGNLAVLQKLIIDGRVVVIAFGFGEHGTCAAVRHLAGEWQKLAKKHPDKGFAHLLLVGSKGEVRTLEEFPKPKVSPGNSVPA